MKLPDKNQASYGISYFDTSAPEIFEAGAEQLYHFKVYIGRHQIEISFGDSVYYFAEDRRTAHVRRGPCAIESAHCATVIRGYMPPDASCSLSGTTVLPYINGCSAKQIFSPHRAGDPTLQYLYMPPHSREQEHHIHSTARVVLVLEGRGKSVVGLESTISERELKPGTVCVFEPMCPHHFETPFGEPLTVAPLHVYSAVPHLETNHPMFNGTFRIN
jgi:mannose-6-phosphate isomerase-like protein (cupin superfamily)